MKELIVVFIVLYFGAVTAQLISSGAAHGDINKKCRQQAYLDTANCTKYGFDSGIGISEARCLSATVVEYMECTEQKVDKLPLLGASPLGGTSTDVGDNYIEKLKCNFNVVLDTVKCIVNANLIPELFIVNWKLTIKCLVKEFPEFLACYRKTI